MSSALCNGGLQSRSSEEESSQKQPQPAPDDSSMMARSYLSESRSSNTSQRPVMASQAPLPPLNPWEAHALDHTFSRPVIANRAAPKCEGPTLAQSFPEVHDSLIFPGLYSGTGFDVMSILLQVRSRPHPEVDLGPVDCSVALVICDLEQTDMPIVYASDAFCELTGYFRQEILGRNCRFLQTPNGSLASGASIDKVAVQRMSQAIHSNHEIQLQLYNYKKNGQRFTNILTIIPLELGSPPHRYAIGFQCEAE